MPDLTQMYGSRIFTTRSVYVDYKVRYFGHHTPGSNGVGHVEQSCVIYIWHILILSRLLPLGAAPPPPRPLRYWVTVGVRKGCIWRVPGGDTFGANQPSGGESRGGAEGATRFISSGHPGGSRARGPLTQKTG